MGVQNAWQFWNKLAASAFTKIDDDVDLLRGKLFCIDGHMLLTAALKATIKADPNWVVDFISLILDRIFKLQRACRQTNHIMVLDGPNKDAKSYARGKRAEIQKEAERKLAAAQSTGDEAIIERALRNAARLNPKLIVLATNVMREVGIRVITADGEAEKECADICLRSECFGVVTEDSDAIICGANAVLRGVCRNGEWWLVSRDKLMSELDFSPAKLRLWAALVGTDFHPGVHGCGCVRARKLLLPLDDSFPSNEILAKQPPDVCAGLKLSLAQFGDWTNDGVERRLYDLRNQVMENLRPSAAVAPTLVIKAAFRLAKVVFDSNLTQLSVTSLERIFIEKFHVHTTEDDAGFLGNVTIL